MWANGRDAAYAQDLGNFAGVAAGYYGGPNAAHVWSNSDWLQFPNNYKLPIWVAGYNGEEEGNEALAAINGSRMPRNIYTVVDMEGRVDSTYVKAFGAILQKAGYKVFVYGSRATVFRNPILNGYWVADWTGQMHMATNPDTGDAIGVRGTQWTNGELFDSSVWKEWTLRGMWAPA